MKRIASLSGDTIFGRNISNSPSFISSFPMFQNGADGYADKLTRKEIVERLDLSRARTFVAGFDRPNIRTRSSQSRIRNSSFKFLQTEHPNDAGIVYCLTRKKTEETADWLRERGWDALPLSLPDWIPGFASVNQDRFLRGKTG